MRRALAILKYVPAVLCGLLVVAWVVSELAVLGVVGGGQSQLWLESGSLKVVFSSKLVRTPEFYCSRNLAEITPSRLLGTLAFSQLRTLTFSQFFGNSGTFSVITICPIPLLIALLLPLSAAPFTRFRFPLWSYFAWTALITAELAYYLR